MKNDALLKHAASVGLLFILLYVACLIWRFTMTDPEVMRFHLLSLKTTFPGFTGYTAGSMLWGGILSFVYGFAISYIFHRFHDRCDCCAK